MLKEAWLADDSPDNLLDQVADLRYMLVCARHFAEKNLVASQKMKTWYDKRAKSRQFKIGDQVLVLLPSTAFTSKVFWSLHHCKES